MPVRPSRALARPALMAALLGAATAAHADAENGFGLSLGPVAHHVHLLNEGQPQNYDSAGVGVGGDAQFVINERWSINPSLQISFESAHGDISQKLSNGEAGLQIRRWSGDWFLAPELLYSDEQVYNGSKVARSEYGPGVGLVGGWESASGLMASVQVEAPEALYFSSSNRRGGVWFLLGYRWH